VAALSDRLARSFLRDTMWPTFGPVVACLGTIQPLIKHANGPLGDALEAAGMDGMVCCLPWVITWFSHDVEDRSAVERLFDAFLASHPAMPLYASAALVLSAAQSILALDPDDLADFATVHSLLAALPRDPSFDEARAADLVAAASRLMARVPPHALPTLRGVAPHHAEALAPEDDGGGSGAAGDPLLPRVAGPPLMVRSVPPPCVVSPLGAGDAELLERRLGQANTSLPPPMGDGGAGAPRRKLPVPRSLRHLRRRARHATEARGAKPGLFAGLWAAHTWAEPLAAAVVVAALVAMLGQQRAELGS